jgi:uncharacterized membrane protein
VLPPDKPIWWELPNSQRIPMAILIATALGFRFYRVYRSSKQTRRSPKVKRIENIIAISLWSFIALAVAIIFLVKR